MNQIVIVSGLSGSGKSVALATLEDCGYYCIDNLPVRLLEPFARDLCENHPFDRTAISIDCRNLGGDDDLFDQALEILSQFQIPYRILFLTADTRTLIQRYSETRRRHPIGDRPLADAIEQERRLLESIAARADLIIDTSRTNIHQLRQEIRQRLGGLDNRRLSLCFTSFGFKHGLPLDADFVFDARCLPNPHWEPRLRPLTGKDDGVADYLEKYPETQRFLDQIETFLRDWLPRFEAQNRSYLTVAIGCTGGQHRSVYLVERLKRAFSGGPYPILTRHRELS
ncbi:RNase adapter protein RapZ [Methylomarinovum caldicuralii]|uniref:RNase adapter protein RapZ n=1 Tax=Methylomarinovum caldicuralii TaxID=438856 RepID=A0AAU9CID2_9GAMM|nr:RNase adapter RapZ [Methylomarinovum caldicuralii]BCX81361.1 RNase adapter protein RapZ [Methylomarinovum caldicuralii]